MKELFFLGFLITYFMPSLHKSGVTLSDTFILFIFYFILSKKIALWDIEKKIILYFILFLLIYISGALVNSLHVFKKGVFSTDEIAFFYFFIISIVFILYSHVIRNSKYVMFVTSAIVLNTILLPYLHMKLNLGSYHKLTSLFVKPNQLAFFLLISPLILVILDFCKNTTIKNLPYINIFILFLYLPMFASASKSGLVLLLLTQLIILLYSYKYMSNFLRFFYSIIFIILLSVFNPLTIEYFLTDSLIEYFPQFGRVANYLFTSDIEIVDSFRQKNNKEGLNMFFDYPLFGVGYGNDVLLTTTNHEIHNTFIRLLATLGIIGTSVFIVFNIYFIYMFQKSYQTYLVSLLLITIFIFGLYHDIFTSRYYFFMFSILLYSLVIRHKNE